MMAVIDHVADRAMTTPRLTAARFGDHAVTYGDLDKTIREYKSVLDRHGLGESAALTAGIVATLPSAASGDSVAEIIDWLGHGIAPTVGLRAVG